MKKKKDYNLWTKLRSAMRAVWMYSPQHRNALKLALIKEPKNGNWFFICPLCKITHHKAMAAIDHFPSLGSFNSWETFADWTRRLFEGNVRVIDKICHAKVTKEQRKKS